MGLKKNEFVLGSNYLFACNLYFLFVETPYLVNANVNLETPFQHELSRSLYVYAYNIGLDINEPMILRT